MDNSPRKSRVAPSTLFPLSPITVVVGHYGVGKTNFSLNLALDAASRGNRVTLVDMDVVNPYFRSSDYAQMMEEAGIEMVSPLFAGSTLDLPSLSGRISAVIFDASLSAENPGNHCLIIDAGGDDAGATALGRYADEIKRHCPRMLYVVNAFRNLSQTPADAVDLLSEIEAKSHLGATDIVNNAHLQTETTVDTVLAGIEFATEVSQALSLPVACTTVPLPLINQKSTLFLENEGLQNAYPVQVYVRTPWEV